MKLKRFPSGWKLDGKFHGKQVYQQQPWNDIIKFYDRGKEHPKHYLVIDGFLRMCKHNIPRGHTAMACDLLIGTKNGVNIFSGINYSVLH